MRNAHPDFAHPIAKVVACFIVLLSPLHVMIFIKTGGEVPWQAWPGAWFLSFVGLCSLLGRPSTVNIFIQSIVSVLIAFAQRGIK